MIMSMNLRFSAWLDILAFAWQCLIRHLLPLFFAPFLSLGSFPQSTPRLVQHWPFKYSFSQPYRYDTRNKATAAQCQLPIAVTHWRQLSGVLM